MPIPDQFFTVESMLTLTGASGVTFLICNGLQKALNFNPKWLALVVAIAISIIGVILAGKTTFKDYLVGFINGFLIYATAAGATEATNGNNNKERTGSSDQDDAFGASVTHNISRSKRRFNSSWFHE